MISRALADEELPVYGKGENVRDWLHVSDHCEAIDLIIHKGKVGEVYNVGGHLKSVRQTRKPDQIRNRPSRT